MTVVAMAVLRRESTQREGRGKAGGEEEEEEEACAGGGEVLSLPGQMWGGAGEARVTFLGPAPN